jgi:hypothetical protein
MINQISETRIKNLMIAGQTEEQIRADSILNRFLTAQEFDLLINRTREELGLQTNEPTEEIELIRPEPIKKDKQFKKDKQSQKKNLISLRLDSPLVNRLNQYLKRSGNTQSYAIRESLKEYLNNHLETKTSS